MKILDLKLQAFGPFVKEQHIPFSSLNDKGIFLINGPTGTGKTSIFDAIVFALYGKGSGKDRADGKSLRSDFAKDEEPTYVDLTFEANGQEYRVVRKTAYFRKAKRGDGLTPVPASAELYMPDGSLISNPKNVDETLENKILFINRDQFKSVALLAQGEFTELITATSKERAEILEHIFQKELYDSFQTKLASLSKTWEEEKNKVITSINTLITQVESGEKIIGYSEALGDCANIPVFLDNIKEEINKFEEVYSKASEEAKNAEKDYTDAQSKLTSIQKDNEVINKYFSAVKKMEEFVKEEPQILSMKKACDIYQEYLFTKPLYKQANEISSKIEECKTRISEAEKKNKELLNVDKYLKENSKQFEINKKEIISLNGRLENLTKLNKQKSAVITQKDTLEKADKKFSEEYKKFSILEQEYRSIRDKFFASSSYNLAKDLKDGMPCPVCGSKAHPSLAVSTDVVSEVDFKSAENNYENKQKLINNLKTSLDSERSAFKEKVNQMIQVLKDNGFADANESMIYSNQLDDLIKTLSQQICDLNQWNIKYESTQKDYVEKSSKLNQELKNQKELLNQLTNDLDENKKNLSNRIEENKLFKNIEQIKELDGINIEKTKENIERFNNEKLIAKTTIDNTPKELVKNGLIDASQLAETVKQKKEIFDGCISAANDIKNKLTNLSKSKRDIKTKYDECKDVLVTFSSISELSKTANGFNRMHLSFKMYILADYFDKIIIQANRRLKRITNGRYKLIRRDSLGKGNMQQGLDLDVYDVETGKNRPASSLSGGEKFVSALSMALGLSDIIETNHALIQVESIFIDEGFGSLDENYLDMAMKALETLKDDNKTVAIISHVEKLKEYISDGLEVKKTDIGSTVYLKENC